MLGKHRTSTSGEPRKGFEAQRESVRYGLNRFLRILRRRRNSITPGTQVARL